MFTSMDSGNSGSLQSSSGGDEEYDSRASASAAASSFINNQQTLPNPLPPFHHHHHHNNPPSIFDPLSNYISNPNPNPNPNPFLNFEPSIWSKPDQINPFLMSSSPPQPDSMVRVLPLPPATATATTDQNNPLTTSSSTTSTTPPAVAAAAVPPARNPKKRSRASRRAPTTVLTTDTTNFRAMVQEFTGIPAPPFASSSPFPRNSRLDLFGTPSSSIRSNNPNSTFDNTPPPYLLRPFPQKLQPPPFLNPTSQPQPLPQPLMSNSNPTVLSNFLNQTLPSSSFLGGLKTQDNSSAGSNPNTLVDDHQFDLGSHGQVSGSMRDGSNYNSYSINSTFQVGKSSETTNNGNATRGEGMMETWICSTSD